MGAPLEGRVVIVDDVITAGTAIREVMAIIEEANATSAAVVVAMDRQERGWVDFLPSRKWNVISIFRF